MIAPRLKVAIRRAIESVGGVEAAGIVSDRSTASAGNWNNINHEALPPLDCAIALDLAAMASGRAAAIVPAACRELGGVFLRLPDVSGDGVAFADLAKVASELGDVAAAVSKGMADGKLDERDRAEVARQLDELIEAAVAMRAGLVGVPQ
jgi:hypothetical protein